MLTTALGQPKNRVQGLEDNEKPATRLVKQVNYQFYSKPMAPKRTILACSAQPLSQKRTTFTQEIVRRLLRTKKEQSCAKKQRLLTEYMQVLKNSGYGVQLRKEILKSGVNGSNKILEEDVKATKPMYRTKDWMKSSRRLDKQRKKHSWLGTYKACVFVPPTPGGQLRKLLQQKEMDMRPGGRENWGIKIIETAGKSLEKVLVKNDPFGGNKCQDGVECLAAKNPKNKIGCRRNNIGYQILCKKCEGAYIGETGENMHTRLKSHLSKFNSKSKHIREGSAFWKHLENTHGGLKEGETFSDYFEVHIVKEYSKPLTRVIEEGTFIVNYKSELFNSKNEWHQPKIIRTTILQGGAEMAGTLRPSFHRDGESGSTYALFVDQQPITTTDVQDTRRITRSRAVAGGSRGR